MLLNLTLVSLTLHQVSAGHFLSLTSNLHPFNFFLRYISVSNSFQSFIFHSTEFPCHFNSIKIKDSIFSQFLNSALYFNFDAKVTISNETITTQNNFLNDTDYFSGQIDIVGCCFSSCQTSAFEHGGALFLQGIYDWQYSNTVGNITNCVFVDCYSEHNGSAIYLNGLKLHLHNTEISKCEAAEFGAVYLEFDVSRYQEVNFVYRNINNCKGNYAIHASPTGIAMNSINITNCENLDFHDSSSSIQYASTFEINLIGGNGDYRYFNLIGNSGDVCFKYTHAVLYQNSGFGAFNIIGNKKVNRILEFDLSVSLQMRDMYIFDNTPASSSGFVPIYDVNSVEAVVFFNLFIDLPEIDVKSNCVKCTFDSSCSFDVTNKDPTFFPYMANYEFPNPLECIPRAPPTTVFTLSSAFTESNNFTKSSGFTRSFSFTTSISFTQSHMFTKSQPFSDSKPFSPSSKFTLSREFSQSKSFTPSLVFSKTEPFTQSLTFSHSSVFTPSLGFTLSMNDVPTTDSFSPSNVIERPTSPFTPSDSFTPSNFFTPNRTKYPDGLSKLEQANVHSENNIFSKEELKKAAGTVSISLALIIASVVLAVFYFKRKMKEVLHPRDAPDFDVDSTDYDADTSYSYSFYTYDYYYTSSESSECVPINCWEGYGTGDLLDPSNHSHSYSEFTDEDLAVDLSIPHNETFS